LGGGLSATSLYVSNHIFMNLVWIILGLILLIWAFYIFIKRLTKKDSFVEALKEFLKTLTDLFWGL